MFVIPVHYVSQIHPHLRHAVDITVDTRTQEMVYIGHITQAKSAVSSGGFTQRAHTQSVNVPLAAALTHALTMHLGTGHKQAY